MKKLLFALLLAPSLIYAQQTTVTASNIHYANGQTVTSGQLCFQGTNGSDIPIPFKDGGGGQTVRVKVCATITSGAISSFTVPSPDDTIPANINYRITVEDDTGEVLRYTKVTWSGDTFDFDSYEPNSNPIATGSAVSSLALNRYAELSEFDPGSSLPSTGKIWIYNSDGALVCVDHSGSSCLSSGGGGSWGSITGTLSSQTDLQSALNGKQTSDSDLTTLATPGSSGTAPVSNGTTYSHTDIATQSELNTHTSDTAAHSATSANTASRIVARDSSGNFSAGTITASLSGNASTSTALAANGANCTSGNAPLGVDASGASEGCFDVASQTELDTVDSAKVDKTTTVNGHALSSNVTVTKSDVSLGNVTNDAQTKAAVVPNTAPSRGQMLVGNAGGTAYAPQSKLVYDVRDYGAVCNGSLANADADTAAIQDAIDDAVNPDASGIATSSGVVQVPFGTCVLNKQLQYQGSPSYSLTIRGVGSWDRGPSTSTICWDGPKGATMFAMLGANQVHVEHLTFLAQCSGASNAAKNLIWADSSNELASGASYTVTSATRASDGLTTFTVSSAHTLSGGESWVYISGSSDSSFDGLYKVLYTNSNTTFTVIQGGSAGSSTGGTALHVKSGGSSGLYFQDLELANPTAITSTVSSISGTSNSYSLTTSIAHYLHRGDIIVIAGVTDSTFDGMYQVTSVDSSTTATISLYQAAWLGATANGSSSGGTVYSGSTSLRLGHYSATTSQVDTIHVNDVRLSGANSGLTIAGIQADNGGNTKNFFLRNISQQRNRFAVIGLVSGVVDVKNYYGAGTALNGIPAVDFAGLAGVVAIDGAQVECNDEGDGTACRFFASASNNAQFSLNHISWQSDLASDGIVIRANNLNINNSLFLNQDGADPPKIKIANFNSGKSVLTVKNSAFQFATDWIPVEDGSGNQYTGQTARIESTNNFGGSSWDTLLNNSMSRSCTVAASTGDLTCVGGLAMAGALSGVTTVDASTGYRISGGATSGNYLRGNGTNFVSSAIQSSDVPWSAPGAIGSVTPASGVFTDLKFTGFFASALSGYASSGAIRLLKQTGVCAASNASTDPLCTVWDTSDRFHPLNNSSDADAVFNSVTISGNTANTLTEIAAPSSPSAGSGKYWYDSTDHRLHDKNSSGTIGTTVVADTGASNNFLTAISAAGVVSKARPTCANLSDSAASCSTDTTNASNISSGTLAAARLSSTLQTGTIALFPGGFGTDGSSGNASAALSYEVSTAAATSNAPKVMQQKLLFDAATDEHWLFALQLPGDYASGGTLRGKYKMTSATSNNVVWKGSIVCSTDSSSDDDGLAYNAVATATSAVPGTQGQTKEFTLALTTTGMAANRNCKAFVGRDADNASDNATGDAEMLSLSLEYTRQ